MAICSLGEQRVFRKPICYSYRFIRIKRCQAACPNSGMPCPGCLPPLSVLPVHCRIALHLIFRKDRYDLLITALFRRDRRCRLQHRVWPPNTYRRRTQPGLSKQLKQLEDELGFLLFVRKGRSLEGLTTAGTQVLAHSRKLLGEAANIRAFAANQRRDGQGQLLIATTHTQARFSIAAGDFAGASGVPAAEHPSAAQRRWRCADPTRARRSRSRADQYRWRRPADGIAIPMFRWRRVVLLPRAHPLARTGARLTLPAISPGFPLVSYESLDPPRVLAAPCFR